MANPEHLEILEQDVIKRNGSSWSSKLCTRRRNKRSESRAGNLCTRPSSVIEIAGPVIKTRSNGL
jgi:hypothetical protein